MTTQAQPCPTKSKGHIIFIDDSEYYTDARGDLFRASLTNVIDCATGYRIGRWECYAAQAKARMKMITGKPF